MASFVARKRSTVAAEQRIAIEVVYALPEVQTRIELTVTSETTVRQAIEQSGILQRCPEIDVIAGKVGIFGKIVGLDQPLREGDRLEIYRPLIASPKDMRRRRARK